MGAATYALTTYFLFNVKPVNYKYILFAFFATLSNYIFHRIFPVYYHQLKTHTNAIFNWTIKHLKFLTFIFGVSLLFSAILFLYLSNTVKIILIALAALTAAYSTPLFKYNNRKIRLRDFSYLKIILIALTWAVVCGNLVLINSNTTYSTSQHLMIFIEKFLFLIAITIPFDIRDFEQDKIESVKTIPNSIGIKQSILIAIICLIISLLMVIFYNTQIQYKLAYLFSYLYAAGLIIAATNTKSAMYYLFYLDASLILLGLLVFIASLL